MRRPSGRARTLDSRRDPALGSESRRHFTSSASLRTSGRRSGEVLDLPAALTPAYPDALEGSPLWAKSCPQQTFGLLKDRHSRVATALHGVSVISLSAYEESPVWLSRERAQRAGRSRFLIACSRQGHRHRRLGERRPHGHRPHHLWSLPPSKPTWSPQKRWPWPALRHQSKQERTR